MVEIIFTKDFATKKKGEKWECEEGLASDLVKHDQVAEYTDGRKVELGEKFAPPEPAFETTEEVATEKAAEETAAEVVEESVAEVATEKEVTEQPKKVKTK